MHPAQEERRISARRARALRNRSQWFADSPHAGCSSDLVGLALRLIDVRALLDDAVTVRVGAVAGKLWNRLRGFYHSQLLLAQPQDLVARIEL
jgi:hypothetical protein